MILSSFLSGSFVWSIKIFYGDYDYLYSGVHRDSISLQDGGENDSVNIIFLNNGNNNYDSTIWFGTYNIISDNEFKSSDLFSDIDKSKILLIDLGFAVIASVILSLIHI